MENQNRQMDTSILQSIDHGNHSIKSYDGINEYVSDNGLLKRRNAIDNKDMIIYDNESYIIDSRSKYRYDKTSNKDFFILSMKHFAEAMKARGITSARFILGIGIPLSHGNIKDRYVAYFSNKNKSFKFNYEGIDYTCIVENAYCYYQGLSGFAYHYAEYKDIEICNVIDLGNWTLDVFTVNRGKPIQKSFTSLPFGLIKLVKEIQENIRRVEGIELGEHQIESMLNDTKSFSLSDTVNSIILDCTKKYTIDLQNELIENEFEIAVTPNFILGGGGIFLNRILDKLPLNHRLMGFYQLINDPQFANAKGYHYLMIETMKREKNV